MKPEALKLTEPIVPLISNFFGRPIRAELYKLNSYAAGGFSGAHRDTPKTEGYLGTLIVCLPSKFTGGNKPRKEEATFNWAEKLSSSTFSESPGAAAVVQWAFSCTDEYEHSVEPVKSGFQFTLTYHIFAAKPWASDLLTNALYDSTTLPYNFYHDLKRCLADPEFLPEGGTVAFVLMQPYYDLFDIQNFEKQFHNYLRGSDALFYSIAILLGLKVEVRTVYEMSDNDEVKESIHRIFNHDYKEIEKQSKAFLFDSFSPLTNVNKGLFTSKVATDFGGEYCNTLFLNDSETIACQVAEKCRAYLELPVIWAFKEGYITDAGAYVDSQSP
jgi:hypothetical protein